MNAVQIKIELSQVHLRMMDPNAAWKRFELPGQIPVERIQSALVATGRLSCRDLQTTTSPNDSEQVFALEGTVQQLIEEASAILEYFDEHGRVSDELHRIRRRLTQWLGQDAFQLPDTEVAFLDFQLRDELADAARALDDPWSFGPLTIDPAPLIQRLVARIQQLPAMNVETDHQDPTRAGTLLQQILSQGPADKKRETAS